MKIWQLLNHRQGDNDWTKVCCGALPFQGQRQRLKTPKQLNIDHVRLKRNLNRLNNRKGVLREGIMGELNWGRMPNREYLQQLENDEKSVDELNCWLKKSVGPHDEEKAAYTRSLSVVLKNIEASLKRYAYQEDKSFSKAKKIPSWRKKTSDQSNTETAARTQSAEVETEAATKTKSLPVTELSPVEISHDRESGTEQLSSASKGSFSMLESFEIVPEMTETAKEDDQMVIGLSQKSTFPVEFFEETKPWMFPDFAPAGEQGAVPLLRTEILPEQETETENLLSAKKSYSMHKITAERAEIPEEDIQIKIGLLSKCISPFVFGANEAVNDCLQRRPSLLECEIETNTSSTLGGSPSMHKLDIADFDPETTEINDEDHHIGVPHGSVSPTVVPTSDHGKAVLASPMTPASTENDVTLTAGCSGVAPSGTEENFMHKEVLTKENDRGDQKSAFKVFLSLGKAAMHDTEPMSSTLQPSCKRLKDGLKNGRFKACDAHGFFLYCLLYAQEEERSTSELVEYWIQDCLITEKVVDAQEKGDEIVESLKYDGLLDSYEKGFVKVPVAIKDFALEMLLSEVESLKFFATADWTHMPKPGSGSVSRSRDQYLLRGRVEPRKAPPEELWENAKLICLMDNELSSLPESPKSPDLLILFLQRNPRLRVIPEYFFQYMSTVKVLNLSNTNIASLPSTISQLKSLEQLILRHCPRLTRLHSKVGKMKVLILLDLHGTYINELPKETAGLTSLEHLKVSFYGPVDNKEYTMLPSELVSSGIISSLISLRNLSISICPGDLRWSKNVESVISDICKLESLSALYFYFPKVEYLQHFIQRSPRRVNGLRKFNFIVGPDVKRMISRVPHNLEFEYTQQDKCLRFVNGEKIPKAIIKVLARAKAFYLDHHLKINNLSKFGVQNINGLEFCIVRECPDMETIIDGGELTFPSLKHLSVHYLESLKSIWRHRMQVGSFASLKYLHVETCPNLNFVLKSSMNQFLFNLEELLVEDCQAIEELECDDAPDRADVLLPKLKSLSLHYLPNLSSIWKGSWPALESLDIYYCPKLRNLHMGSGLKLKSSIKTIKAKEKWWNDLEWEDDSLSRALQDRFAPHLEDL